MLLRILILLLLSGQLAAQDLRFSIPFTVDQIPQVPMALEQDYLGFLWIGTTDGLYRYDGYEVREFRKIPGDTASLVSNYIFCLVEDAEGILWVGTRDGLCSYNPDTEKFKRYNWLLPPLSYVYEIAPEDNGMIWLATRNGVVAFDPAQKEMRRYLPDAEGSTKSLLNPLVWNCFWDSKKRLWAATHGGVSVFRRYSPDSMQVQSYPGFGLDAEPGRLLTDRVFQATEYPQGTIWLGTHDGIFRVEEKADGFYFHAYSSRQPDPGKQLRQDFIEDLVTCSNGQLWAATYPGGLEEIKYFPSKDSSQIIHHAHDPERTDGLPAGGMRTVLSANGVLWVATKSKLLRGTQQPEKFNYSNPAVDGEPALSSEVVLDVLEDSKGNLWVAHTQGLSWRPANSTVFQNFRAQDGIGLSDNFVTQVYEDKAATLWLTTRGGGLHYLKLSELGDRPRFRNIFPSRVRQFNRISDILETKPGIYLLATDYGLRQLEFDVNHPDQFHEFEHQSTDTLSEEIGRSGQIVNAQVGLLAKDRFGDVWLGTGAGLARIVEVGDNEVYYDNYRHEAEDAESISNSSIRCIFRDSQGRLWVGTRSGLNLVVQKRREERATFKKYGSAEGLVNDVIHSIQEDRSGKLWFSTNRGLVHFDPDAAAPVIKTYTGNGIPNATFVYRSSTQTDSGQLYFGTADGLIDFNPQKIYFDSIPPELRFTRLSVLNEVVLPAIDHPILKVSIAKAKAIQLRHTDNLISLDFTALDFRAPEQHQYRYRFSALGDNWIDNGNNNQLTLTNIPTGKHTLEVLGTNADGVWARKPIQLLIYVSPPPWRTWWAYTLYALTAFALAYFVLRYRLDRKLEAVKREAAVEKARLETRQALRDRNAADFHDELGHRITKIQLHTTLAERNSPGPAVSQYLHRIKNDTLGLTNGIRDLIWSLDTSKDSLHATLIRLREFGDELFENTNTHFAANGITPALEAIEMQAEERKHLLLLFKEAMNNCLKYAQASEASLTCHASNGVMKLVFQDNGVGFNLAVIERGYGLRNMKKRAEKIGATLIVATKIGGPTVISCQLNLNEYPKEGSV